ncbi:penicillin-binding protein activator LpoB [Desulfococcaceae bacterium OttesenSCG-928-F15]|nr:penicillin-binding protein activator LpoB [Desulfococcaceae bacterium OttesenSCG-928-F15]
MTFRMKTLLPLVLILLSLGLAACSGTTVKRVDPNEEIALTDKWNATDSRLVSEEMIADMLSFPWITRWRATNPKNPQPTVIVLGIRNRSHEHISVDTFVNDLRRAMIRSGAVDFVAAGELRDEIRAERLDQEFNATPETAAAIAMETGANFALSGSIDSFVDQLDGSRVTSYQVDLRLTDMTSNREVWSGQKKIQKLQKRSRFGF